MLQEDNEMEATTVYKILDSNGQARYFRPVAPGSGAGTLGQSVLVREILGQGGNFLEMQ